MHPTRLSRLSYVLLLFVLVACQAPATAAPTAVPPTAVPPSVAAQTAFSPKPFKIPLSVSFGPDWQTSYDLPGKFAIDNQPDFGLSFYVVTHAQLADPADGNLLPFPQDFVSWIKSDPDFKAGVSTPVMVAGLAGTQLDVTPVWKSASTKLKLFLSLSGDKSANLEGQPDGENIVTDPEQWRFILLNNVNGERLLIILIAGNGHSFADAAAQSQTVLDTVAFAH